jgi:glycopeptide antibiotics resistance protein
MVGPKRLRDESFRRRVGLAIFLSALAAAFAATMWPFRFHFSAACFARIDWRLNYRNSHGQLMVNRDFVQNLVMLSPMGAGWALFRAPRGVGRIALEAIVLGLGTALVIETLQIFAPTRYPQVADVWRNGAGCAAAAATVAWLVSRVVRTHTGGPIRRLLARGSGMHAGVTGS